MHNNSKQFDLLEKQYKSFRRRIPNKVAITAVNFFKRNFKVGGFVDRPFKKWKPSAFNNRTTMIQSGATRRDIKKLKVSQSKVVVGIANHNHYAKIHNTGGKIPITPKMRRFFWAMHLKTAGSVSRSYKQKDGSRLVFVSTESKERMKRQKNSKSKSAQKLNDEAERWKALALTKKTHIDIPKRQFIGDSKALEVTIERMLIKELKNALK